MSIPKLSDFNPLIGPLINHVYDKLNVIIFEPTLNNDLKDIAENSKFKGKYTFWYTKYNDRIGGSVVRNIGVPQSQYNLCIVDGQFSKKFLLKASSKKDITNFLENHQTGKIKPFFRSAKRPTGDKDVKHPHVKIVVHSSFEELIINNDDDVFLDVWAPWCGPCIQVGPIIDRLANALKNVSGVVVAKIDCDSNDIDSKYFSVRSIPMFVFFPKGKKNKPPVVYNGKRKASSMIEFISKHGGNSFKVDKLLVDVLKIEKLEDSKKLVATDVAKILKDKKHFENDLSHHSKIQELADKLTAFIRTSKNPNDIDKQLKEFQQKTQSFRQEAKKLYDIEEKKKLKNVKKIHSYEEYQKFLVDAGNKLVVLDYTASWCGPCRFIAPHFADFSVKYADVVFLKVDIDQVPKVPQKANPAVKCYPTFHFLKNGKFLKKFEGADKNGIEKLISELK